MPVQCHVPFVPNKTPRLSSATTTTMALNAENFRANTSTSARIVKPITLKSDAPKRPQLLRQVPTPINSAILAHELSGYPNDLYSYIVDGFTFGFSIGCTTFTPPAYSNNHASILRNKTVGREKISKELKLGRIAGPFSAPPFHDLVCSPLGLVPKKTPNEYRIIHDLSFPEGASVNNHIPPSHSSVQYESIENEINLVKQFGRNSSMAKMDIKDGFRNIPIHPSDYHLLGFVWNNEFYYDKCLPMGASSSCQIFEQLSSALQWIMLVKYKAGGMSHLIDDFFFIGPAETSDCLRDLTQFNELCKRIGIPIKTEKTVYPTTVITIYGIEIDSNLMQSRLPDEKLTKLRTQLATCAHKRKIKLKDLQSFIGLLNFACQVIVPGRAFLRRLIDLTCGITNPNYFIRLGRLGFL